MTGNDRMANEHNEPLQQQEPMANAETKLEEQNAEPTNADPVENAVPAGPFDEILAHSSEHLNIMPGKSREGTYKDNIRNVVEQQMSYLISLYEETVDYPEQLQGTMEDAILESYQIILDEADRNIRSDSKTDRLVYAQNLLDEACGKGTHEAFTYIREHNYDNNYVLNQRVSDLVDVFEILDVYKKEDIIAAQTKANSIRPPRAEVEKKVPEVHEEPQKKEEDQPIEQNPEKEKEAAKQEPEIKAEQPSAQSVPPIGAENDPNLTEFFSIAVHNYNVLHGTKIDAQAFASEVIDSWQKISSQDEKQRLEGKKQLKDTFSKTLKNAFAIEAEASYANCHAAIYTSIAKDTNELLRAAMYSYTDAYIDPQKEALYGETAFGGMTNKEIVNLATSNPSWEGDQKSDEAWRKQSAEARKIAGQWQKQEKPYDHFMSELKSIYEGAQFNDMTPTQKRETLLKLSAAECMLMSDENMMLENPDNPFEKTPNWSHRHWKALSVAREKIGIFQYCSMRDLIQGSYAGAQERSHNSTYLLKEGEEQIFLKDGTIRPEVDSLEGRKVAFAETCRQIAEGAPAKEESAEIKGQADLKEGERIQIYIPEVDERRIESHIPKTAPLMQERVNEMTVTTDKNQH